MLEIYEELTSDDARMARAYLRRLIGFVLVLVAVAFTVVYVTKAYAAPRVQSGEECQLLADMALVARALAEDKMPRDQADRIMARIYKVTEHGVAFMNLITAAAYRDEGGAGDFASRFLQTCVNARGNVDSILGTDS